MSESKWKQIIGKKISEGAYVSPQELREAYLRAMPTIAISNDNGKIKKDLENTRTTVETLSQTVTELREENRDLTQKINTIYALIAKAELEAKKQT